MTALTLGSTAYAGGGGSGYKEIPVELNSHCKGRSIDILVTASIAPLSYWVTGIIENVALHQQVLIYWNEDTFSKTVEARDGGITSMSRPKWYLTEYNKWSDAAAYPDRVGKFKAYRFDEETQTYVTLDELVTCKGF